MSGQNARDVIAEALYVRANHPVPENEARTAWRDYAPDNLTRLRYLHMADAALDGLTAADFTVVELPEPSRTYGNREAKWTDRSSFSEPGYLKWSVGVTEGGIPFASARSFADAINVADALARTGTVHLRKKKPQAAEGMMTVTRTEEGVEPPLNPDWSPLAKLRWKAALVALDTGLSVRVHHANVTNGGAPIPGLYGFLVGQTISVSAFRFEDAWAFLNGVSAGARAARRRAAAQRGRP